ncbi:MAG: leucine--tRNA ligase [Candidatus Woesearchaeota archaeon]|nr:MAG: leucine--tRNA ligase [Candidatus Woesearchaeota archaeon]
MNDEHPSLRTEHWHRVWEEKGLFLNNPDERTKFFVNFPFPYVNGYPHLGHLFSFMRCDVMARYKRLKGFNVLFSQGFHATGQPIVAAAQLVKDRDEKQIALLLQIGIPESDIPLFENPEHWISFFSKAWKEDLKKAGASIDWRRSFITTDINPPFDKFVRWQYNKLQEKGYIVKGSHPVVWCPKAKQPIGDHDRKEGEGVTPEEVTLVKFTDSKGRVYPAMTFRPETVFGVSNMWINPEGEYVEVEVLDQKRKQIWIVSKDCVYSLEMQHFSPKELSSLKGKELLDEELINPVTHDKVPVLPASFVDMSNGTGVVMSVPAHAPYDYVALRDLKKELPIIALIKVSGYGKIPAKDIVERMGIKDQLDPKLKEATKELYKKEHHTGIITEQIKEFEGKSVSEAKEALITQFKEKGFATSYYTLTQPVISRQNARAVVALVDNQYFLNYSNPEWKKLAHECVDKMRFYPEQTRQNYHYTIDWLKDWACARDKGIGTRLPWDEAWLIESLSDSTIYMAYYTIAHYLQNPDHYNIKIEKIGDSFFTYVFLGEGKPSVVAKESGISEDLLQSIREEFLYWYEGGYDFRSSGKDLIQNHLTFSLFHHTALFPKEHWPSGISVNGYILLNNEKMSKSKGNFITFREAIEQYGVDASRFAMAFASDVTLDDANFDTTLALGFNGKLAAMMEFAKDQYGKGREEYKRIDSWFDYVLDQTIDACDKHYNNSETRSAMQVAYFDLSNHLKWYTKRTGGSYNKEVISRCILTQALLLAPVLAHTAEELFELLGQNCLASQAGWPTKKGEALDWMTEREQFISVDLVSRINKVKEMKNLEKISSLTIVQAPKLKFELFDAIKFLLEEKKDFKEILMHLNEKFPEEKKFIAKFLPKVFKEGITNYIKEEEEREILESLLAFLEREYSCKIVLKTASEFGEASTAIPAQPAIVVE